MHRLVLFFVEGLAKKETLITTLSLMTSVRSASKSGFVAGLLCSMTVTGTWLCAILLLKEGKRNLFFKVP